MSDETTEKSSKVWLYVTGSIIALPLLYVLSIGPVGVLAFRGVITNDAFNSVYAALIWFVERTDTGDALEAYTKMWFSLTGTPELRLRGL